MVIIPLNQEVRVMKKSNFATQHSLKNGSTQLVGHTLYRGKPPFYVNTAGPFMSPQFKKVEPGIPFVRFFAGMAKQ